jgi:IclR family acetate operon transcriptional repressor
MGTEHVAQEDEPKSTASKRAHGTSGGDSLIVRSLLRGMAILALFDADHREWTIDAMAEHTGLQRMTVYRMVRTLESVAFLGRDATTNRYHLGPANLASNYLTQEYSELVDIARPYIEKLVEETGESVSLAVEMDGMAICVDILDTSRPFRRGMAPGRIIGDTSSANGKIFAAFKNDADRAEVIASPHPKLTPNTITDPDTLAEALQKVASEDVAFDLGERNIGACAVGSPVRGQSGAVIAAISVVVPAGRFGPQERERCTAAVKRTAATLSAYLGWHPPTER